MHTKTRRRTRVRVLAIYILVFVVLVSAVFMFIGGIAGLAVPDMRRLSDVRAVVLEDIWAGYFSEAHSRDEQETYLSSTLDEAAALGANTVLLTGTTQNGELLLRGMDKTAPAVSPQVKESDRLFNQFDPVKFLIKQADRRDMQVALFTPEGQTSKDWTEKACRRYKLSLYEATAQEGKPTLYTADKNAQLLRMDQSPGMLAAAHQLEPENGIVLGALSDLVTNSDNAALILQFLSGGELPDVAYRQVPQTVNIVSPDSANNVFSDSIFLMGTSDPSQPLEVNGTPVERQGDSGVWGLLVPILDGENVFTAQQGDTSCTITDPSQPLEVNGTPVERQGDSGVWGLLVPILDGENVFTAQQGDTSCTITLKKPVPGSGGGSGGSGSSEIPSDGSVAAQPGQKVRVTSTLASQLSDYTDTSTITASSYEGAVGEVVDSVSFVSGRKRTFAYQLANGSYLLAKNCELLDPSTPDAAFTQLNHTEENGVELLTFSGSGTPIFTHTWEGNEFTLHFLSAGFSGTLPSEFGFAGASVTAEPEENGFALHFTFTDEDPLWGYFVDYLEDGTSRIVLKHAPHRSDDPSQPLLGITVMLDPGHGDTDMGAPGSPVEEFPQEGDLNLSAALAAKYRLEQLGATVLMSRDTDVFYELHERLNMLNQQRPDFFISIHHNSALLTQDLHSIQGTEAYWFYTEGKTLADQLSSAVSTTTARDNRGPKYSAFYVTRSSICPAVLLELGFVVNPTEYESCASLTELWAEGGAIAQAVLNSVP